VTPQWGEFILSQEKFNEERMLTFRDFFEKNGLFVGAMNGFKKDGKVF